jgi:hypothetical protein
MQKALGWAQNGLVLVSILALGFWIGAGRTAKESGYDSDTGNVEFQLAGVNQTSSLLVYLPGTKTVCVYQGATTGNSALQCSYMFQLTRPGEVIHRDPCGAPSLIP